MRPTQELMAAPVPHPRGVRLGFVAGLLAVTLGLSLAGLPLPGPAAQAATGPVVQAIVSTHQTMAATSLTSGALTTTQPNELLVAFLASDGPGSGRQTFSAVTGGGLTWTLRQRTNAQAGTAEVWQAVAASPVAGLTVLATRSSGSYLGSVTVAAFTGADVTRVGAVGSGSGPTGAPSAGLTTTSPSGWVWAVGDDWDTAANRTVGTGQEKVDEYLAPVGDTFWVQRRAAPVAAGTSVTINDTAPTTDRWNLSLVEIPGSGSVSVGPILSLPAITAVGIGSATVGWTTDVASTSQVEYGLTTAYGSSSTVDPSLATTHSVALAGLSPATTYHVRARSADAAGNVGVSADASFTTASATDTTPPSTPTGLQASASTSQVTLTWTASTDNVGVTGYDVLRGGVRVAVVTTTAYNDTSVQPGTAYTYTVSAHDAAGNASTASAPLTVTTAAATNGVALDRVVTTHQGTGAPSISAPALSTAAGNELLLAFLSSDGPSSAGSLSFSSVSGGGLTWRLRQRTNAQPGTAEVWQAVATTALAGAVITATRSSGSWQGSISVAAFSGADTVSDGAVATASAAAGAASVSLAATRAGSTLWAAGTDWDAAVARTIATGQTLIDSYLSPAGDTYWVQKTTNPAAAVGATLTVADTGPTTDSWDLAAVEVRPATPATTPDTTPPVVALTAPAPGASVSGTVTVTATASDNVAVAGVQLLIDGAPLGSELTAAPYTLAWDSATAANGTHVLSARARDTSGNTATSSSVNVGVTNTPAVGATLDASTPGPVAIVNNVPTTLTPAFSPPAASVLYVALSLDAAAGSGTVLASVSNSGVPLTWRLLGRENHSNRTTIGGDVEVWWAYNAGAQSGITVTGNYNTLTKNVPAPVGDLQVLVFNNAAADQSTAAWSPAWLINGTSGTPSATVTTTATGSRVLGVFDSWNSSASPTPGTGQTVQSLVLNPTDVDGYWVQIRTSPVASPSSIVMGATLADTTEWHALAWEVLPLR
jgi:hypothetical protein